MHCGTGDGSKTQTFADDFVVMHIEHLRRDEHILNLLQKLWPEAGHGDLLRGHEGGQSAVQVPGVG